MHKTPSPTLVTRYRKKFGLSEDYPLSEAMVQSHWELERRLARELLNSPRDDRWAVFERCYTALYQSCPWLNDGVDSSVYDDDLDFGHFLTLLKGARDIYEVGSGKARLLGYLARNGFRCVATEITRERGERWIDERDAVIWRNSDGINLTRFEAPESYDVVVSTHVIEHMHPEDLLPHMENVLAILRPGGRYVLSTPHRHAGPMDLSEVFDLPEPICMHLREYSWGEAEAMLRQAGFAQVEAIYVAPRALRRYLPLHFSGSGYLAYVKAVERLIGTMPAALRQRVARHSQPLLFRPEIFLAARKAG